MSGYRRQEVHWRRSHLEKLAHLNPTRLRIFKCVFAGTLHPKPYRPYKP